MQRFGTASVPTHSIGLAILKSDWQCAIDLILSLRPGEHPEVEAARRAWLDDGDLDTALALMPRRVVAERCILESYKKQKGDTRNPMGTLSTVCIDISSDGFGLVIEKCPTDSPKSALDVYPRLSVLRMERHRF